MSLIFGRQLDSSSILNTAAKSVDKRRQSKMVRQTDRQRVNLIGSQEANGAMAHSTTATTRMPAATTMRKITVGKITTTSSSEKQAPKQQQQQQHRLMMQLKRTAHLVDNVLLTWIGEQGDRQEDRQTDRTLKGT